MATVCQQEPQLTLPWAAGQCLVETWLFMRSTGTSTKNHAWEEKQILVYMKIDLEKFSNLIVSFNYWTSIKKFPPFLNFFPNHCRICHYPSTKYIYGFDTVKFMILIIIDHLVESWTLLDLVSKAIKGQNASSGLLTKQNLAMYCIYSKIKSLEE